MEISQAQIHEQLAQWLYTRQPVSRTELMDRFSRRALNKALRWGYITHEFKDVKTYYKLTEKGLNAIKDRGLIRGST